MTAPAAEGDEARRAAELERRASVTCRLREIAAQYRTDGDTDGETSTLRILEERQEQWAFIDQIDGIAP